MFSCNWYVWISTVLNSNYYRNLIDWVFGNIYDKQFLRMKRYYWKVDIQRWIDNLLYGKRSTVMRNRPVCYLISLTTWVRFIRILFDFKVYLSKYYNCYFILYYIIKFYYYIIFKYLNVCPVKFSTFSSRTRN